MALSIPDLDLGAEGPLHMNVTQFLRSGFGPQTREPKDVPGRKQCARGFATRREPRHRHARRFKPSVTSRVARVAPA